MVAKQPMHRLDGGPPWMIWRWLTNCINLWRMSHRRNIVTRPEQEADQACLLDRGFDALASLLFGHPPFIYVALLDDGQ
eukprot:12895458-Prorocentrum_lima.AAC.1